MIDPSLAVQKAIVARLIDSCSIAPQPLDANTMPATYPAIIVGEAHEQFPDYADDFMIHVYTDVHVWTAEDNLASVKQLSSQIREALFRGPWSVDGHICANLRVESARFLRDPDGKHSHAVLSVTAMLQELEQPR